MYIVNISNDMEVMYIVPNSREKGSILQTNTFDTVYKKTVV